MQNLLPLIIHIVIFLNVVYNYGMLFLQIADRRKENMPKIHNEHEMETETNEQFNKSLFSQATKKGDGQLDNSSLFDNTIRTTHNKLVIKNNATATSLYNLKRPQLFRPERSRKNKKNATNFEQAD